jgi:hypothetical protein
VDPYEHRGNVACDHCEFQGICRIDPWVQSFRALTTPVPPRAAALTDPANPARPPSRRGRKAAASPS